MAEVALSPEQDRTAEVLAARARRLARPLETPEQDGATVGLLGFEAGGERFALPVGSVVTVISAVRPTTIPGMPPWLVGAIGVRGRVVALVSPEMFLASQGGADASVARPTAIVVADDALEVALLVDRLEPVETIPTSRIVTLPAGSSDIVGLAASGIVDGRLVIHPGGLIKAIHSALQPLSGGPPPRSGPPPREPGDTR